MAGIAQKICVVLSPLWFLKKIGGERGGRGRTDANQQKHTKNLKLKINKKSF